MTMPNFLVIGVGRSGTTSLHSYLSQHPQVFMSTRKEPHFFQFGEPEQTPLDFPPRPSAVQTLTAYQALFSGATNQKAIGESSVSNFRRRACHRIHHYLPRGRFICLLRQPVDRQYSAFLLFRKIGTEPMASFPEACRREAQRYPQHEVQELSVYGGAAWYVERLRDWFAQFDRQQFYVGLFDDFKADPASLMRTIYAFLGVDDSFAPGVSRTHNASYVVRHPALQRFLQHDSLLKRLGRPLLPATTRHRIHRKLLDWGRTAPPPLNSQLRRDMTAAQRDDILRLQDLIGRDLSRWLAE